MAFGSRSAREVRNVSGASWQEDIGSPPRRVLRAENGPCVVFDDIPGCPKGFRVLLNMFAGTRRNMTPAFPDHLSKWELSDSYREAYLTEQKINTARNRSKTVRCWRTCSSATTSTLPNFPGRADLAQTKRDGGR